MTSRSVGSSVARPFQNLLMNATSCLAMGALAFTLSLVLLAAPANVMAAPDKRIDKRIDKNTGDKTASDRTASDKKPGENKAGDKKSDRPNGGDRSSTRFSKFRLTPDEVKQIVDLVEKDDPALANKLRRVMTMQTRRSALTDRPTQNPAGASKKPTPELTPEQIAGAIEIFKDRDIELGKRIESGLKENPERVKRMLSSQWQRIERMIALKKNDPQLYKAQTLEIHASYKMFGLAAKIRSAKPGADTTKLREELRSFVSANLEARHQVRRLELKRLEDRVAKLKKQIADNEKKMDKAVDGRVKELLKTRPSQDKSKTAKSVNE